MDLVKESIRKKTKKRASVSHQLQSPGDDFLIPQFAEEDTIKLSVPHNIMSSDNLEYICVPFKVIEEIFLNDIETFFSI